MTSVPVRTLPTLAALYRSGAFPVPAAAAASSSSSPTSSPLASSPPPPLPSPPPPTTPLNDRIVVWSGNITALAVDAIVNAANSSLLGGGGVDGAIHRAAGPQLRRACAALHGCATGDAKITPGYALPSRYVVHTVGPVYYDRPAAEARQLLASCYRRSLEAATAAGCRTIAFCAISTGVYGYPAAAAARVAATTVRAYLESAAGGTMERVVFVAFDRKDREAYEAVLPEIFPIEGTTETTEATEATETGAGDGANETDAAEASKTE